MKFDPDSYFIKRRTREGGVWYEQKGHKFSSGFNDMGKIVDAPDVIKKDQSSNVETKADIRARAASKLQGYKESEKSDAVALAMREDQAAKAAEEFME